MALISATRGEAGEIQRPGTATAETLPQVRQQELFCSAAELGVAEAIILNYRDSGMGGSPDNEHPRALINIPDEVVVARLVGLIRRLRPQVVLTFEPYGGYGHPDHVAIHRHTVAAFHAAGDPDRFPDQGKLWQPDRLFFPLIPSMLFREIKARVAARGGNVDGYDEIVEGRRQSDLWQGDRIHAIVDISDHIEQKWSAWHCHQTQFGPNSRFRRLPDAEMKEILSQEYFTLAYPAAPASLTDRPLADLFQPLAGGDG